MKSKIWILIFFFLLSSCVSMFVKKEPFITSSLDFNNGKSHEVILKNLNLEDISNKVIVLAKERKFMVTKKDTSEDKITLRFKSETEHRQYVYGSTSGIGGDYGSTSGSVNTANMDKTSYIFVEIYQIGPDVKTELIGVPALRENMSCPSYLSQKYPELQTKELLALKGSTLTDSIKNQYGFDISGRLETEVIEGIIAELK